MKVAFVGKGGSGKTTLSALFCRALAAQHLPVLAIDADINQHLGTSLGFGEDEVATIPPLGQEMERIKEYLRGSNPRIRSAQSMIKTTPPGPGSRFLSLQETNTLLPHFERQMQGVRLLVTGPFDQDDLGTKCYHSKVGAVELLLNHFLDQAREYIVVDMTAGADSFASGLFTRFDMTFIVVEPTIKSVSVYKQYQAYAQAYKVALKVIGNKVEGEEDVAFLRQHVGDDLLTWIGYSGFVRAMEKGQQLAISLLEAENLQTLVQMQQIVDHCVKDWEHFYSQAVHFHRKNALNWGNAQSGEDLTQQIDSGFSLADVLLQTQ